MTDNQANIEIAKKAFAEIQKACPDLHAVFDDDATRLEECITVCITFRESGCNT